MTFIITVTMVWRSCNVTKSTVVMLKRYLHVTIQNRPRISQSGIIHNSRWLHFPIGKYGKGLQKGGTRKQSEEMPNPEKYCQSL